MGVSWVGNVLARRNPDEGPQYRMPCQGGASCLYSKAHIDLGLQGWGFSSINLKIAIWSRIPRATVLFNRRWFKLSPFICFPDALHTYFGLCGLSLMQEPGLRDIHAALNITQRAADHLHKLHNKMNRWWPPNRTFNLNYFNLLSLNYHQFHYFRHIHSVEISNNL